MNEYQLTSRGSVLNAMYLYALGHAPPLLGTLGSSEARRSSISIISHQPPQHPRRYLILALGNPTQKPGGGVRVIGIPMLAAAAAITSPHPALDLLLAPADARTGSYTVVPREWSVADVGLLEVRV